MISLSTSRESSTMTVSRYWARAGAAAKSNRPAIMHAQDLDLFIGIAIVAIGPRQGNGSFIAGNRCNDHGLAQNRSFASSG